MKLYSRILGKGDPVIIMHGLFGASDNWLTIGKALAEHYKCFLLDLRNHGRSPHSPELNYDDMSEDLYEFLTDFNLRTVSVIGHSMGGMTAMKFALEYPHRVAKLVVVDIAPRPYPVMHGEILAGLKAIPAASLHTRKEADKILAAYVPSLRIRQFLLKSLQRTDKGRYAWRINLDAISDHVKDIGSGISGDNIFEKPTLFIRGGKSDFITDQDLPLIKKKFPQSNVTTIAGGTHWLHAEKPDELIQLLREFL
jgi:pimeloyl-ACP methyl ester carboxylesterase